MLLCREVVDGPLGNSVLFVSSDPLSRVDSEGVKLRGVCLLYGRYSRGFLVTVNLHQAGPPTTSYIAAKERYKEKVDVASVPRTC